MERTAGVGEDVGNRVLRGFDRHVDLRRDGEIGHQGRRLVAVAEIGGDDQAAVQFSVLVRVGEIVPLVNMVGGLVFAGEMARSESGPAMK